MLKSFTAGGACLLFGLTAFSADAADKTVQKTTAQSAALASTDATQPTLGPSFFVASASLPEIKPRAKHRPEPVLSSRRPAVRPGEMPALRWDHVDGSEEWTRAAMDALGTHGAPILDVMPRDIDGWCPAYPDATLWERKAFWAGLLSTLAKHESTYRPTAVGGGGKWYGLVQILPATARGYKCEATTRAELKNGAANMSCAVRILATTIPRDGVVSAGWKGVAADWGPFHQKRKRDDMRQWVSNQPFCKAPSVLGKIKPKQRPDVIDYTDELLVFRSTRNVVAAVPEGLGQRPVARPVPSVALARPAPRPGGTAVFPRPLPRPTR